MNPRGALTLVFDDGYQAVYEEVLPLLAQYNVRAVFAVPLNPDGGTIAGQDIAPVSAWQHAATSYDHELSAHGISHTSFLGLSPEKLAEELSRPHTTLPATTVVYPGGAHNDDVVAQARRYYKAGRTVIRGLESLPPQDPMRLRTINFSKRNFSVARANIHALRAHVQNKWLIETYHMVSKHPSSLTHSALISDLEAHLDFITSIPIRIGTIQDIL